MDMHVSTEGGAQRNKRSMYCIVEMVFDMGCCLTLSCTEKKKKNFTQQLSLFVFLILFYSKNATYR